MIYGASLGAFVKKAFGDKGFQTSITKIIEALPAHLEDMDAVILGPKDTGAAARQQLEAAVMRKHPALPVIFFYVKDSDAGLIGDGAVKIKVDKVTPEIIHEEVSRLIDENNIGRNNRVLESSDEKVRARNAAAERVAATAEPAGYDIQEEQEAAPPEEEPAAPVQEEQAPVVRSKTLEERIAEMGEYGDFHFFRRSLEKDQIFKDLLQENTEYAALVNLLDRLDDRIIHIFKDVSLPAEVRFEKIKEVAVDRSAYKGMESSMIADKVVSVMAAVIKSAEATIDTRISNFRQALDTLSTVKSLYEDQGKLQELVESRLHLQMDLMDLSKEIIEVYKAMDSSVEDFLEGLDEGFASHNEYVNGLMKPVKPIFTPNNIAAVTSRLVNDLQQNRVALSIMEDKIKSMVNLVFKLCEEDASIIDYQQKLIRLLKSQRVEEVVVVDSLIKKSLRIFVGPSETGRTATALTWSGIVSRRQNTILLDLTGDGKTRQYGMEPVALERFLEERMEQQFLCIEGSLESDPDRTDEVVAELKTRLNYYANIHVVLDASQTGLLERLAGSALSVHFITDCTPRGTRLLKQCIEGFQEENVAQKVILIDPPIDPLRLLQELSVDPLITKLVVIPRLQYIRACSLNNERPYESKEVLEVFEEAFR
jgi:hypothetical protein